MAVLLASPVSLNIVRVGHPLPRSVSAGSGLFADFFQSGGRGDIPNSPIRAQFR